MTAPLTEQEQDLWHAWKVAADMVRQRVAEDIKAGSGLSDQDFGILTRLVEMGGIAVASLTSSRAWRAVDSSVAARSTVAFSSESWTRERTWSGSRDRSTPPRSENTCCNAPRASSTRR